MIFFKRAFSVIIGVSVGLFVYSYAGFPYGSKRLFALSLAAAFLSALFYYVLFATHKTLLKKGDLWKIFTFSAVLAPFLFFLSSIQWQRSDLFGYPFLPTYTFEITVSPESPDMSVEVLYFSNSFGEVSFDTLQYEGWWRGGGGKDLLLTDKVDNLLVWKGKIGEDIEMHFRTKGKGQILVHSNADLDTSYDFSSEVIVHKVVGRQPWLASRSAVLLLGNILFFVGIFTFLSLLWPQRGCFIKTFSESLDTNRRAPLTRSDLFWMAGLVFLAVGLRVFNLDDLPPHLEEYQHLNAAKQMLNGVPWGDVYSRSLYIVTLPVYFFFSLFGVDVAIARLPGVLTNSLAVIPVYLLMRKMDRRLAIFSAFLFATSPYMIAFSRSVREYAYYPFYFYGIVLLMVGYLEYLYKQSPAADALFDRKQLVVLLFLLIPPIYVFVDPLSTAKVLVFPYGLFSLFVLRKVRFKMKMSYWIGFGILMILSAGALVLFFQKGVMFIHLNNYLIPFSQGDFNTALNYFFYNPAQQWYYDRLVLLPVMGLFFVLLYGLLNRKHTILFFLSCLYLLSLVLFLLFFSFVEGVRFYVHVQLWHILLIAMACYGAFVILNENIRNRIIFWIVVLGIVLVTFNPCQVFLSQLPTSSVVMPISLQSHESFDAVHDFLSERVSSEDALIAYDYGRSAAFLGEPSFSAIYTARMQGDSLAPIIRTHRQGWIVVNEKYYSLYESVLPLADFKLEETKITYVGDVSGDHVDYIWRWEAMSGK